MFEGYQKIRSGVYLSNDNFVPNRGHPSLKELIVLVKYELMGEEDFLQYSIVRAKKDLRRTSEMNGTVGVAEEVFDITNKLLEEIADEDNTSHDAEIRKKAPANYEDVHLQWLKITKGFVSEDMITTAKSRWQIGALDYGSMLAASSVQGCSHSGENTHLLIGLDDWKLPPKRQMNLLLKSRCSWALPLRQILPAGLLSPDSSSLITNVYKGLSPQYSAKEFESFSGEIAEDTYREMIIDMSKKMFLEKKREERIPDAPQNSDQLSRLLGKTLSPEDKKRLN